ncbi:hypothetical protein GCM10011344_42720 [Dokdonia pacifica]|uniref:Uncharacterized protein n=1 Tax=Dokdonia pacifica TaxID=1627892 RepID=A0A239AJH9_9FLAO|nr:hypothetical protein [Dokdonia pacifica]GGG37348.1 hypothetical protein GCM10011344_42720 [Dokdonia pacifica]SNR95194.1 hypothetical protein SAMN06265376_104452 [Dokdonia pacifica]
MEENKDKAKNSFNEKQKREYPGNHPITGKEYQKGINEKPISEKKIDALKKTSEEYDKKSQKLDEIKKRVRRKYGQPIPKLQPKGSPLKPIPKASSITKKEERLAKVTKRLKDNSIQEAKKNGLIDKAKNGFNKEK